MKITRSLPLVISCCLGACVALAQEPAPLGPSQNDGVQGLLLTLVSKYPWLATLLLAMGSLRLVMKPTMLAIEWYTKQTPNPNDDVAVLKFQAGPIYKVLSIGLDLIASVKVPSVITPPPKK